MFIQARRKAFTLVELLVVIGIIAVLISVLMPALQKARAKVLQVKCTSNLRQIHLAMTQYANDNDGWIRPYANNKAPAPKGGTTYALSWMSYICPDYEQVNRGDLVEYMSTPRVLICPTSYNRNSGGWRQTSYALNKRMFGYTSPRPRWIGVQIGGTWPVSTTYPDLYYYRLSATKLGSLMWLVSEGRHDSNLTARGHFDTHPDDWPKFENHTRTANMLFHDGHVEPVDRDAFTRATQTISGITNSNFLPWRNVSRN